MKTEFYFDGVMAVCTITDGDNVFEGKAYCHEQDMDFASERTGLFIAEGRAVIKRYQHIKNNKLKPAIGALKHVENNAKQSKYYNSKSHENILLQRQIHVLEEELAVIEQ